MHELKHSKLSCSGAHRWVNCPGSIRLSEGAERKSSSFADEGTKAHEILAEALTKQIPVADVFNSEKHSFAWSGDKQEHLDSLEKAQAFVDSLSAIYGVRPLVEVKLDLSKVYPGMFGTCDICFVYKREGARAGVHIADYKHGSGVKVEVYFNEQLMLYAIGAVYAWGDLYRQLHSVDVDSTPANSEPKIGMSIIQPRMDNIRTGFISYGGLSCDIRKIKRKANEAMGPSGKTTYGDHCRFCPAQFKCQTWCDEMVKSLPELEEVKEKPVVNIIPSDKLISIVEASENISSFLSKCKQELIQRIHGGEPVEGYSLELSYGNRKWISEEKIFEEFKGELDHSDMVESKLKSPAKLEKLLPIQSRAKVGLLTERPVNGFRLVKNKQLTN